VALETKTGLGRLFVEVFLIAHTHTHTHTHTGSVPCTDRYLYDTKQI